ncbi:MAG: hypothetical protein DI534_06065 [Leifsonia xyli]|nr:MAG: hypothetical protein DI534_06065 [Leifsonia xyli]
MSTDLALPPRLLPALASATLALARADVVLTAALALAATVTALLGLVVIAHGIAILLLVLFASGLHELAHLAVYRTFAPHGWARLECGGLRAALERDRLPRTADRMVTAAGPLAPLLLVGVAVPLAPVLPAEAVASVVIALGHALGLLLPTADRRAWQAAALTPPSPERGSTLGA